MRRLLDARHSTDRFTRDLFMSLTTCPNCGYGFDALRKSTRMFDCPSCNTTLFRQADALAPMGNHGEMHDVPMLIRIGDQVHVARSKFDILGHIRFDYGRGFWDEFWAENRSGKGAWFSVDEGDVVLQYPLPAGLTPNRTKSNMRLGDRFALDGNWYTVTETDKATCAAFRGQLPEQIDLGETHSFLNASGDDGGFLSGERWEGGEAWYEGRWLDPFELKIEKGAFA